MTENLFGLIVLSTISGLTILALIYQLICGKNLRIIFDRIISRGKFRSTIMLVLIFITFIYLLSWAYIHTSNLSSNELVQYDNNDNQIKIEVTDGINDSGDSIRSFNLTFTNKPTKEQHDSIVSLINDMQQSGSTGFISIPPYSESNDSIISITTTKSSNAKDISDKIFSKIDSICEARHNPGLMWSVYYHIIDPGNQHMARSPLARIFAIILSFIGTIFLGGLFISILTNVFDNRRERWAKGNLRYNKCFKNYYIIIGSNEMVPNIVNQIFDEYRLASSEESPIRSAILSFINPITSLFGYSEEILPYIVIFTSSDIEHQRELLFSQLDIQEQKRIVFYYGNRGSKDDINSLKIHKAKEVYILGESVDKDRGGQPSDYGEPYHDTLNMTSVKFIAEYLDSRKNKQKKKNSTTDLSTTSIQTKLSNCQSKLSSLKNIIYTKIIIHLIHFCQICFNGIIGAFKKLPNQVVNKNKLAKISTLFQDFKTNVTKAIIQAEDDDEDDLKDDFEELQEYQNNKVSKNQANDSQEAKPQSADLTVPNNSVKTTVTDDKSTSDSNTPGQVATYQSNKLVCHVLFEYQTTFSVFQTSNLSKSDSTETGNNIYNYIDFRPFNFYESWAQKVFVDCEVSLPEKNNANNKSIKYTPLDGFNGISANDEDKNKFVHLIIVGMSKMGIAMALEAAHICHFPNFATNGTRTRITFIDSRAQQEMDFFKGRFKNMFDVARWRYFKADDYLIPGLFPKIHNEIYYGNVLPGKVTDDNIWRDPLADSASESPYKYLAYNNESFLDIEWEFIEGTIESPSVQKYLTLAVGNTNAKTTVAICLTQAHQAIAAGIYMPKDVYQHAQQVMIYQRESDEIINNITENGKSDSLYKNLKPFGMIECSYNIANDNKSLLQAKLVNYVYETNNCKLENIDYNILHTKWDNLIIELKWSNIYNSNSIPTKLRSFPITTDQIEKLAPKTIAIIDAMAKVEHNRWNVEKLLLGYKPLTEGQSDELIRLIGTSEFDEKRKKWKERDYNNNYEQYKSHIDLRSYDDLDKIHPGVKKSDKDISMSIPYIIPKVEQPSK